MEVRGLMSSYAQSWDSALNDSQRAAWEQWAKTHKLKNRLGKDTELTAIAWFCRISFNRVWYRAEQTRAYTRTRPRISRFFHATSSRSLQFQPSLRQLV